MSKRMTQAEVRASLHAAIARLENAALSDDPSMVDAMIRWCHLELGKLRRAAWGSGVGSGWADGGLDDDFAKAYAAGAERCAESVRTGRRCVLPVGHAGEHRVVGAAEAARRVSPGGTRVLPDWRCPTCKTREVASVTDGGRVTCGGGHVSR